MNHTVVFPKISHRAVKHINCFSCGKKVRRQRTFYQTVNPYNLGSDGLPKTELEIEAELADQADVWQQQGDYCIACDPGRR